MEDVLKNLEQNFHSLTSAQRKVADYIIQNPVEATFSTIDQIARKVDTSTTTIVRLTRALGLSGYAEFQKELQDLLKSRTGPTTKLELNLQDGDHSNNAARDIAAQITEGFNKTLEKLDDEAFFAMEKMLKNARHIHVIGLRSCFSIAHFLSYNLDRIFAKCDLLEAQGDVLYEKLERMRPEDMLIAISMPRYVKNVVRAAEIAKNKGMNVIVITDGLLSPLAKFSDILFSAECKSRNFHNSMSSAMLVAEIILGVCAMRNLERTKQNLKNTEAVLRQFDVHVNIRY